MKKILIIIFTLVPLTMTYSFELTFEDGEMIIIKYDKEELFVDIPYGLNLVEDLEKIQILRHYADHHPKDGVRFIIEALIDERQIDIFQHSVHPQRGNFNSICHLVGRESTAYYRSSWNREHTEFVPVGNKESGCYGRCGPQCGSFIDRGTRYTQECLNHDACHRTLNRQLGPCAREFWRAAYGFFFAPHC